MDQIKQPVKKTGKITHKIEHGVAFIYRDGTLHAFMPAEIFKKMVAQE